MILIKKYSTYLHMRNQREPVQKTEQQFLKKMNVIFIDVYLMANDLIIGQQLLVF